MRQFYPDQEEQKLLFAKKAAEHFAANPGHCTYRIDELKRGEFLALRWGAGCDCVVVLKIDEYDEIINYCNFIPRDKADLTKLYEAGGQAALLTIQKE